LSCGWPTCSAASTADAPSGWTPPSSCCSAGAPPRAPPRPGRPTGRRRAARPHGRRPLPADLPRCRVEHPVDPKDLACACGACRRRIGQEVSEQLEYAPAGLFVIQHVRPKYACPACEQGVVIADKPPQPIERGLPGPGLIAHVIVGKYADHLPLYRLEGMLARHGVDLDRSTLGGWVAFAADLLMPLVVFMAALVRGSKVINTDDTPVPVLDRAAGAGGKTRQGRLWVYHGDDAHPYVVFDYTPDRCAKGPAAWLAGYNGFLQADAYSGYDGIYAGEAGGQVVEVGCWAHARRKFYEARGSDPVPAHEALAFVRQLYAAEDEAGKLAARLPAAAPDARERAASIRLALRQAKALPVLDAMHAWLLDRQGTALPKSPLGVAIGYSLNNWDALKRYAADGDLAIDNNVSERAMKHVAVGRKNWLFAGGDEGGRRAAAMYSLVATCRRHGIDPWAYLHDVLARIASTPMSQLGQFLPDRWKSATPRDPRNTPAPAG
jgi:transposase